MAQRNPPNRINVDAGISADNQRGFFEGVDSYVNPMFVRPTQLRWLVNGVTSGGMVQTRPGYKERFKFDLTVGTDFYNWWIGAGQPIIHPQMEAEFVPSGMATPQLVFAISGGLWYALINPDGSLQAPKQIVNVSFNYYAAQLSWCRCIQTTTITNGVYANSITPKNLLIIQDGANRAVIWDGFVARTMNPAKKITVDAGGNTLYPEDWNQTRIGFWMAWSGNRLFIFNGPIGYASDLGDPTHFTEELRLNSLQFFVFPSIVTGAIDRGTSGTVRSQVVVGTGTAIYTLWSGNQQRFPDSNGVGGWVNTPDFQARIFSAVGCVSGKSMIVHRGLLYWQSEDGIVMFDSSGTVYSTQNLPPIDYEMAYSKRRISPNPATICAGIRSSYVFFSVPTGRVLNGRVYNSHTQILDRQTTIIKTVGNSGPFSYGTTGWQGVWTGIRPVEWASPEVSGMVRSYALSMDLDGVVRIWEAFQGNRADNGRPIPWTVETRAHPVQETVFDYAEFRFFRVLLDQIVGNLSIVGSWRGLRGQYHEQLRTAVTVTPGSFFTPLSPYNVVNEATATMNFRGQGRDIVSTNVMGEPVDCQAAAVESPYQDSVDRAFSLLLNFVGRGALVAYRMAVTSWPQDSEGAVVDPEAGFNIVPEAGCPVHVDGVTPDYTLADDNPRDAFVNFIPVLAEDDSYRAPGS